MRFHSQLSLAVLAGLCMSYLPAESTRQVKTTTADVDISNQILPEALVRVGQSYRVVIGLERSLNTTYDRAFSVHLDHATLDEALDAVVKANPGYQWRRDKGAAVRVFNAGAPTLPRVVIRSFFVRDTNLGAVVNRLEAAPEVTTWLRENNCQLGRAYLGSTLSTPGTPNNQGQASQEPILSMSTAGRTLAENLDEAARLTGAYFWEVGQWGGDRIAVMIPGEPQ
jgi:hypothetical protein